MKITCDQVAWMLNAIGRYMPHSDHPSVSRVRDMKIYGCLYEIMEIAESIRNQHDSAGTSNP